MLNVEIIIYFNFISSLLTVVEIGNEKDKQRVKFRLIIFVLIKTFSIKKLLNVKKKEAFQWELTNLKIIIRFFSSTFDKSLSSS